MNVHDSDARAFLFKHGKLLALVPTELVDAVSVARDLSVDVLLKSSDRETLENALALIYGVLWPSVDPGKSWDSDTPGAIAGVFSSVLGMPGPEDME
jgi:hypothetical protein